MSTLTVTVAGTTIEYGEVELTRGTSDALPAPEAEIQGAVGAFTAGDSVTIETDTATLFTGQVARPRIRRGGRRDLTCEHDLAPLFEESVDVPPTTSVTTALESTVANASTPATVQFDGTDVTLGEAYEATGRSVRRIFADLTERTGRVWRVVDPDTIVVEPLGANGSITVDTTTADATVRQYDPGDARTVINDVTVNGTGGERVVGTASDATSINQYGARSNGGTNVNYIETQSEADAYADALLRPDPLAAASVVVGARSLDVVAQQANATLTLTDPSRGIDSVELVVEEQTNTSGGSAVLKAGEGAASSLVTENRQNRSRDDTTEPGSVYNTDRTADDAVAEEKLVDLSVTEQKLADLAVATDKLQNNAVINGKLDDLSVSETKIQDGSISTPKLLAEAVTAAKIEADTITANEIAANTITALEILADTITADEIAADTITALEIAADAVTANEIDANTITADEIDALDLDTTQLTIGQELDGGWEFGVESFGGGFVATMTPFGAGALIGTDGDRPDMFASEMNVDNITMDQSISSIVPSADDEAEVGSSTRAFTDMYAYNFIDAGTGTAINDGGDPLAGLADGHGPPDTCEVCDDKTGETKGYSVNGMAREAWDVIREQTRRIEDLEARLAALEGDADPNA